MTDLGRRVVLDLFAGPGGWSEGLRMHGLTELGIEWDAAACETARAAGHARYQADVSELDPLAILPATGGPIPCWGLIASPPCQAWSMAGKGGGRRDVEHVIACALEIAAGNDTRAEHAEKCEDARSLLVVEPLRWARALEPEWIALEQVPPVLELWTLFAQILEGWGYSTWTGILEAERYGVPQTRERAVLMAHRHRPVHPPVATHQRFVKGEPQRHDVTLEGEVLPWVSMEEALGWKPSDRIGFPRRADGGQATDDGYRERDFRTASEPAFNLTEKARSMTRVPAAMGINNDRPERKARGAGNQPRPVDEPAATVDSTVRQAVWLPTHYDCRYGGFGKDQEPRSVGEPAPTQTSQGLAKGRDRWLRNNSNANAGRRPVSEPAPTLFFGHANNEVGFVPGPDDRVNKSGERVTQEQAAILQSFRPDYPWQGSRSKQFEQIGNAVPPLLAHAVLGQLIDPAASQEARRAA